jgi:phosphatidylglycerophosphate synthase
MDDLEALKKVAWNVPGDIATNLFFRPLSIRITRALSRSTITPTQVTVFLFCLRMIAAVLFLFHLYFVSILAAILLYFAQVLDCVDGELSRVKNLASEKGGLIDWFLDRLGDFIVYLSIAIGLYFASRSFLAIVLGLFVIASNSFMTDIWQKTNSVKQSVGFAHKSSWKSYLTYGGPTSVMILLVTAVLNQVFLGMVVIGACCFLYAVAIFVDTYLDLRSGK